MVRKLVMYNLRDFRGMEIRRRGIRIIAPTKRVEEFISDALLAPMPSAPRSIAPCWCSRLALLAAEEWHKATRELWRAGLAKIRDQFARRLWWIPLSARSKTDSLDDRTLLLSE